MNNELLRMFKYPSMIKCAAFCAATYGLLAVMLKNGIVLLPEVSEVRICNILAVGYGIFFGPAGAVGVTIGNIIGDMSGSLTNLSPFGAFGNFLTAYLPYKIWCVFGAACHEPATARPTLKSPKIGLRLLLVFLCSVPPCAATIAFSTEIFDYMPAVNFAVIILSNNVPATAFGIVAFLLMCLLPKRVLPYWRNLMENEREFSFNGKQCWVWYALSILCIAVAGATLYYMVANGLSLAVMDSFGNQVVLWGYGAFALLSLVAGLVCTWKLRPDEDAPIEL